MGLFQTGKDAKAAYDRLKKWKKTAKEYYELAKKLADEDTRSGELFKLGLKGLMKMGEKIAGQSLSKHPYFTYHKKHLEALVSALNASETSKNAMKALHEAVSAADSAAVLSAYVKDIEDSKARWMIYYDHVLAPNFETYKNLTVLPEKAHRELAALGMPESELREVVAFSAGDFRGQLAALFFDALDLLAMVDTEARAAEAAYKRYQAKVNKLTGGKAAIDRVAGLGTEYQRQLEWADRVLEETRGGSTSGARSEAIVDPGVYARQQRDLVQSLVERLARLCDAAMSDELIYPVAFKLRVSSL